MSSTILIGRGHTRNQERQLKITPKLVSSLSLILMIDVEILIIVFEPCLLVRSASSRLC